MSGFPSGINERGLPVTVQGTSNLHGHHILADADSYHKKWETAESTNGRDRRPSAAVATAGD